MILLRMALTAAALTLGWPAAAQNLDLGGPPGAAPQPIQITASQGIEWQQAAQTVTAMGNAKAVRGAVTVEADQLVAHYRKKAVAPGTPAAPATPAAAAAATDSDPQDALNSGGTELYQLDAVGHVHIFTATDNAYGDKAVYNMDSAVLVLTGTDIKLTTPSDVITAKDAVEYYSTARKAIARGDARIVTKDGRSIAADTLIGYLAPAAPGAQTGSTADSADPLSQSGQLKKVEAIGHVTIRTSTDIVTGDRGVYLPQSGRARLGGNVRIMRGPNLLTGNDALVNMKSGVATLLAARGGQVAGTIVPNSAPVK